MRTRRFGKRAVSQTLRYRSHAPKERICKAQNAPSFSESTVHKHLLDVFHVTGDLTNRIRVSLPFPVRISHEGNQGCVPVLVENQLPKQRTPAWSLPVKE